MLCYVMYVCWTLTQICCYTTCEISMFKKSQCSRSNSHWFFVLQIFSAAFHDLYISSDEKLFNKILTCPNHILLTLLSPPTAQNYSLRNRLHNRQLPDRISRITDCIFTVRMLYRNMYRLLYRPILDLRFVFILVYSTTAV